MSWMFGGHIQGLSDRDVARLRRLAANGPLSSSLPNRPHRLAPPSFDPADRPWPRHADCALAERLLAET